MKVPKKVSFFLWTTTLGKILTLDNLTKRGFSLVNWCCMCRSNAETVDHLLIHCDTMLMLCEEMFFRCLEFSGLCWEMLLLLISK